MNTCRTTTGQFSPYYASCSTSKISKENVQCLCFLYAPLPCRQNSVCYPATHDNETTEGWWKSIDEAERQRIRTYLGARLESQGSVSWAFIDLALSSVANTAIVSVQDILSLDNTARFNTPGRQADNWNWRMSYGDENKL